MSSPSETLPPSPDLLPPAGVASRLRSDTGATGPQYALAQQRGSLVSNVRRGTNTSQPHHAGS